MSKDQKRVCQDFPDSMPRNAKLAKAAGPDVPSSVNDPIEQKLKIQLSFSLLLPSSTVTSIAAFLCSHNRLVPLEAWSYYANEKFGVIFNHYTHASLPCSGA